MNRLILIFLVLISFTSNGQDSLKQKISSEFKRLLIGVNISTDYCYRTLSNDDGSASISKFIELRNNQEVPKIGYSAGINLNYNISRLLGFEIGVQYSNKGYATKKTDLTFGDMIDPRYGFVYNSSSSPGPTNIKFSYNHLYLDIPVRAVFSFGKKRIHFVTSIGMTTNIFLKATTILNLEYENGETESKTQSQQYNYKTIDISPTISVGADYKISNKINLRAEPTFRYGLLEIIDSPITAYLWNCGLNITCYYKLK